MGRAVSGSVTPTPNRWLQFIAHIGVAAKDPATARGCEVARRRYAKKRVHGCDGRVWHVRPNESCWPHCSHDGEAQFPPQAASRGLEMLHATGVIQIKQAIHLREVPTEPTRQVGLANALCQHLGIDGELC